MTSRSESKSESYYIKSLVGFSGHSALYVVNPSIDNHEYVIVVAGNKEIHNISVPCTRVYPSNEKGQLLSSKPLYENMGVSDHTGTLELCGRPLVMSRATPMRNKYERRTQVQVQPCPTSGP
jgi:hypothetical protein